MNWISSFLEYSQEAEPCELYLKWVAVFALAAALQRKCWFALADELTFYPNFYIVLIGPSGARKDTALNIGVRILRDLKKWEGTKIHMKTDAASRQGLIQLLENAEGVYRNEKGNPTIHHSLTMVCPELTVLTGYGDLDLLTWLNRLADCADPFEYHIVSRPESRIGKTWFHLIGGTTPQLLQSSLPMDAIGSGFIARTIFVYASDKRKVAIRPKFDAKLRNRLLHELKQVNDLQGNMKETNEFMDVYGAWVEEQEITPPFDEPKLERYLMRRRGHLLKLCIVMSAASRKDMRLTVEDFNNAADLLAETEEVMPRAFRGIGRSDDAPLTYSIVEYLEKRKTVTREALSRLTFYDADEKSLLRVLSRMSALKMIDWDFHTGEISWRGE